MISLIMPVFNDAERLERCLKSLQSQTEQNFELIAIDDGSTDSSKKILTEYAQHDSRISVLDASRIGPYGCRNLGLNAAKGEYIGFIDSDDWMKPDALEEMAKPFDHADVDSTLCSTLRFNESNNEFVTHFDFTQWPGNLVVSPKNIHQINGATWNKLYKKENIERIGLRFSEYRMAADIFFNWVYYINYPKVRVISKELYVYTYRGDSIVTRSHGLKSLDLIRVMRDLKLYLTKNNFLETHQSAFYTIAAKGIGPRFMRERRWMKIPLLLMTFIWIGPGLFNWGFKNWHNFSDKIKRY